MRGSRERANGSVQVVTKLTKRRQPRERGKVVLHSQVRAQLLDPNGTLGLIRCGWDELLQPLLEQFLCLPRRHAFWGGWGRSDLQHARQGPRIGDEPCFELANGHSDDAWEVEIGRPIQDVPFAPS